jgi:TRAP-type mannitol/chloroaromatic compound transport system permease small subunit
MKPLSPRNSEMSRVLLYSLKLSSVIDAVNERIGRAVCWLVLLAVLISSANALVRYVLNTSSNAWLELQWYLFAAIITLCAGYTLLHDEHIRIDIVFARLPDRTRVWLDLIGGLLFLLPVCIVIGVLSWPVFVESYVRHETSGDAGGLIRWPVKLLIPVGFLLLTMQALSEIVKRIAFLKGAAPNPARRPSVEKL